MSDELLCVKCARCQKTCCQEREIYVTPGDVERISNYTTQNDFYEYRVPADPSYLDQDDDPIWAQFVIRADHTRRSLKRWPGGDCLFLGPQGCRLPLEVRPLVCRMYPFEYNHLGIQDGPLSEGCPTHLLRPGQGLLAALDMNRADAERWHQQLYQEVLLEAITDVDRVDLRPAR